MKKDNYRKLIKLAEDIIVAVLVVVVIFLVASVILPKFSYSLIVIKTASMEPTMKAGSVVISKKLVDYEKGDVITFNQENKGLITHRITEIIEENGVETKFRTKGDANDSEDRILVSNNLVIGKSVLSAPYFGYLVMFAKRPLGIILLIILPAIYLITNEVLKIKKELHKRRSINKE